MKKLEQVKEYFKNAKEVRCLYDGVVRDMSKWNNFFDNEDDSFWNEEGKISSEQVMLFDGKKYAEIISYKENPIQHDDFNEYTKEIIVKDAEIVTPKHYNNENGTLYKVANQRNWNPYLFDIVKRLERADKKGEFESDLNKSIAVIQLWLKESKNETM